MNAVIHVKLKRGKPRDARASLGVFVPAEGDEVKLPSREETFRVVRRLWHFDQLGRNPDYSPEPTLGDLLTAKSVELWLEAT